MKDEELIKDTVFASFWKVFRFLLTEMISFGFQRGFFFGTSLVKESEYDFAKELLDKALRIDASKIVSSQYTYEELFKIFRNIIGGYD